MTCCQGRSRNPARSVRAPELPIEFEYCGRSALTAIGSATRRIYWFEQPGARVRVHPHDALSLETVPTLRRV
jgi:hypothetical protein